MPRLDHRPILPTLIAFLAAVSALPCAAQLSYLTTQDLELVFPPEEGYLAPHAARCFENSLRSQRRIFGYEPHERINLLLNDFSDLGNASAATVPRDNLTLRIAPLSFAFETAVGTERVNWILNHEMVHITAMDQAAAIDRAFRGFFRGKVVPRAEHPESILYFYLTVPRVAAPGWYQEGIATFSETWMAGGLGRAQGSYDEMVFRSMVRDKSRFYDPLGLVSEGTKIDFQVSVNSYLYGTRFMSYLAYRYSPEELVRWVSRTDGSKRYYAAQFRQVFGLPLEEAWDDWVAFEHEFQQQNLDALREYPLTPYQDLSPRALGSVSSAWYDGDTRKIYAAFNYPGVVAHVGAISVDDGAVEKIIDLKGPSIYQVASLAYDAESKTIFYTTDNVEHRDLNAVDPATGKSRTLLKDARIGDLVVNRADRSIWGVRHFNGYSTLVRVPPPYKEWQHVYSLPYGEVFYGIDISPDGRLLSTSLGEINGRQTLRLLDVDALLQGEMKELAQVDFEGALPLDFRFSNDGRYLYGSSYYTGVANIFRYEIATGEREAVSNTDGGFFRPIHVEGDTLIVFRYTGEGFVPAQIEAVPLQDLNPITYLGQQLIEKHPVLEQWKAGRPSEVDLDAVKTGEGEYRILRSLRLESLYPVVEGYKDSAAAGFHVNFSDPMSLNVLYLTASYSPDDTVPSDERAHLDFKYQRYNGWVELKWNDADFYDLFGPTKKGLKGYSIGVGYDRTLVFDKPRKMTLALETRYWGGLERLPGFQNVAATFDELLSAEARLDYENLRSSLGHVDDEKGHKWEVVAAANHVNGGTIPLVYGSFDAGAALPQGHSSLWLRTSAGLAFGERDDPFANFFFGGFGNNWVDHAEVKRYRGHDAFPGVRLNDVGGRNYAKAMVEWNLPPLRFRRLGTPGFYASWARASIFAAAIATNLDTPGTAAARRELLDVGVQVDLKLTVISRLDLTLSLGYAAAMESGRPTRDEVMVSLNVFQ